jgi:hypothetical protein
VATRRPTEVFPAPMYPVSTSQRTAEV